MKFLIQMVNYLLLVQAAYLLSYAHTDNKVSDVLAPRIIHGYKAHRGQFPYQVALLIDGVQQCGGSIISDSWALTAAHCITEEDNVNKSYSVVLGGQTLNISEDGRIIVNVTTIPHPDWDSGKIRNDIGLLKFSESVEFNDYIKRVKLPTYSDNDIAYGGEGVQVSGWGIVSTTAGGTSNELNYVNLTTITTEECESFYGDFLVPNITVCATSTNGDAGPCSADSGGPLVINHNDGTFTQIGVVSFVEASCEGAGGYARVSAYLEWISEVTGITIN